MKKRFYSRILAILLLLVVATSSLTSCGFLYGDRVEIVENETTDFTELSLIDQLFKHLSLFELDEEALLNAVIKGYIEGTGDKYAEYFTAEEYEKFTSENQGETVGVGINVIQNADLSCIEIINVVPESPAMKAGVLPGDYIVYVGIGENRESVAEIGYTAALDKLIGEKGTLAEFVVLRDGEEIEFSIVREKVVSVSVTGRACTIEGYEKVGIIKLTEFNITTPVQFEEAVDALLKAGCDKFIFDVRYNPGGDLNSIKAVLAYFLNNGDTVIRVADRSGNETVQKIAPVKYAGDYAPCSIEEADIGKYRNLNFAVLTNGSTASAAELFTSALMDYELSITVGTTTYGKGTMQTTYPLAQYGYGGALKLTTRYYFPPLSDSYEGKGITPDFVEELDESLKNVNIYKITDEEDNQLRRAIEELYNRNK
jgi:carboxyl-terminal processing protease